MAATAALAIDDGFLQCTGRGCRRRTVWLIIAEALIALGLLVFIVWWTMFSGRKRPPGK